MYDNVRTTEWMYDGITYLLAKGKRANLETDVSTKQSISNFLKNEHFLPPDTQHVRVRIRG